MSELSPVGWALRPIRRYADFTGRAPRAEYWWYVVATTAIGMGLGWVDQLLGASMVGEYGPLTLLLNLGLLVPGLAVVVRRLHDIGRSGWWALLSASGYAFMIFGLTNSTPEQTVAAFQEAGTAPVLALVVAWGISMIVMLVFMITRGEEGSNKYGRDPYSAGQLEEIFA